MFLFARRFGWSFVAGAFCASVSASAAEACKCAASTREKAIAATPLVFEARVLRVREEDGQRYADVEMVSPVKGAVPRAMEVATPVSSAACGYNFRKDERLTVGVTLIEGQYRATSCVMLGLNGGRR